jgi:hypothetical protein
MITRLDWCPCIDDQTRIDFAHTIVQDICQHYTLNSSLTLVSLGSGALKQEELITSLLIKSGYTHITLNLIDTLYTQSTLSSLADLDTRVSFFESTQDFEKLGDLYVSLEHTDNPEDVKKIETKIEQLEQKIKINEYVALCDQQAALLHPERLQLLQKLLPGVIIHTFTNVQEYLPTCIGGAAIILLYIDPDNRPECAQAQKQDFAKLSAHAQHVYKLDITQ